MAIHAEPDKKGIISLIVMMILIVLVVALSQPLYKALSGGGVAYTSVQQGYGGEVKVTLSVKDGVVDSLMAEGLSETPGIGGKAIAQFNETAFAGLSGTPVADVNTELDAVSGATVTSGAVASGFQDVLNQAAKSAENAE